MTGFLDSLRRLSHEPQAEIADLFTKDPQRPARFRRQTQGVLLDLSKTSLTEENLSVLLAAAEAAGLTEAIRRLFASETVNATEGRAAEHWLCRRPAAEQPDDMHQTTQALFRFAEDIRTGQRKGLSGKAFRFVISIGIGGSHLGPQMVSQALACAGETGLSPFFVSTVEASALEDALARVDLEETLFIVASKSFSTPETLLNAASAREKLLAHYNGDKAAVAAHFVAVSSRKDRAEDFGIDVDVVFPFRDSIGGRYSVWSPIGLPVLLSAGARAFENWQAGACAMDTHFATAPLADNLPVLLALAGIWHRNVCGFPALAVVPYHQRLARFPAWLQQIDMESNGKASPFHDGTPVTATGPIVFGEIGTDAQHSFFQWLHQSDTVIPVEFIGFRTTRLGSSAQHNRLLANLLAQGESLMRGQRNDNDPHRHFPGNRPSVTLLLDELTPFHLGQLMALYEHKIYVQGALWGINSFDQFGVELGKIVAADIEKNLSAISAIKLT